MLRNWMRIATVPVLAVALAFAACSDTTGPVLSAPHAGEIVLAKSTNGKGPIVRERKKGGGTKEWKAVTGKLPEGVDLKAEQIIGREGGILYTASHALVVPEGAVPSPTKFKIMASRTPVEGDSIVAVQVSLKAYRWDALGNEVSVGEYGFAKPVIVALSYSWARTYVDPATASILWLKSATEGQEVTTRTVDYNGKWIIGYLDHFSDYLLAMP